MAAVRKILLKLHLWIGIGAGLFMAFTAITGAILVWSDEIDRLLNPGMMTVRPQPGKQTLTPGQLIETFEKSNPKQRAQTISLSHSPSAAPYIIVRTDRVYLDPYTARVLGRRDVRTGFVLKVHQLHTKLLAGEVGEQIVGWTTVSLLFIAISGIWLWWKRKILATRRNSSWWRINFDLHNFTGIYSAIFLIVMCLSGILMAFGPTLGPLVYKITGPAPDWDPPEVEWQKGVPLISWDRALTVAGQALPGATPTFAVAANPRNGFFQVSFKFPEDGTPGGRSRVYVAGQTGEVLDVVNSRLAHPGIKVFNWNRPVHTGDLWGLPTRVIWFTAALLVVAQAVSGFLIWWKRYSGNKAAAKREQKVEEDVFA